ncbi:MAG: GNAT family N-acetyltransferase [Clostridiales bacterium]|nr:GNAT family N-acetyltransferase [Clostridiales bacterium]
MDFVALTHENIAQFKSSFADLYTLCFNVPMDGSEVDWRYASNPMNDIFSWIAVENGQVVANYSVSPIEVMHKGKPVKCALSLNTMTHPDFSGRGLFIQLANMVYKDLKDKGYAFVMGFPNNISNRTFVNKLGWRDILVMPTMKIDIDKARVKPSGLEDSVISDDSFKLSYTSEEAEYIHVNKSGEYLKWRISDNPTNQYSNFVIADDDGKKAGSYIVVKEFRNLINIVDCRFRNESEMRALMNRAIAFANEKQKESITFWLKLGCWEHLVAEGMGAVLTSPVTYFGLCPFKEDLSEDFFNAEMWYLNMCDDNVY